MRHRLFEKALLKLGFTSMVSALALISLCPMEGSLAHDGMSPQRKDASEFLPSRWITAGIYWPGVTSQFGLNS
jgi:hypothetical protein